MRDENRLVFNVENLENRTLLSAVPGAVEVAQFEPLVDIIEADGHAYLSSGNLYKSDGTPHGTRQVTFLEYAGSLGATNVTHFNGHVFFTMYNSGEYTLNKVNTSTDEVTEVKRFDNIGITWLSSLTATSDFLYFVGSDYEVYRTDGTTGGTIKVTNIMPASNAAGPRELTAVGNTLFFRANDGVNGDELWATNGTLASTRMVHNFYGTSSGSPSGLTELNGKLYFAAYDSNVGRELWSTDGNTVSLRANIRGDDPWVSSSSPTSLTAIGNKLYFNAWFEGTDNVFFFDDLAGTLTHVEVLDDHPFRGGAHSFVEAGGTVFFKAYDDATDTTLWKTDGTPAGTYPITDFKPGASGAETITYMMEFDDELYFALGDTLGAATQEFELWKTDGNTTQMAFDLTPAEGEVTYPYGMVDVNGKMFFMAKLSQYWLANHTVWTYAPQVIKNGTAADDVITVSSNSSSININVNGTDNFYPRNKVGEIIIRGSGGNDRLVIHGESVDETVTLKANGKVSFLGNGFTLAANGFEETRINSNGGDDTAVFFDSDGNDRFIAKTNYSQLKGNGFDHRVNGFLTTTATASSGNDLAFLYDSAGDNQFIGRQSHSVMKDDGINFRANGFDRVYGYASDGYDRSTIYDTAGNNRFYGYADYSVMKGDGIFQKVVGFDKSVANASTGNDIAYLRDNASNNTFVGRTTYSQFVGNGLNLRANGFDKTFAYATNGGNDLARLYDSYHNEELFGKNDIGKLTSPAMFIYFKSFDRVHAYGENGGTNTLNLQNNISYEVDEFGLWL